MLDDRAFTITGVLGDGGVVEGEIWMPLSDLMVLSQRDAFLRGAPDVDTSAIPAEIFASTRLDLELTAIPEVEYFSSLDEFFGPVRLMVIATAVLSRRGAWSEDSTPPTPPSPAASGRSAP